MPLPVTRPVSTLATLASLLIPIALLAIGLLPTPPLSAKPGKPPTRVMIDTDIGDDIDDAFAVSLALNSQEIQVDGITTAWGDTHLRARLVAHLLSVAGRTSIPVAQGIETRSKVRFTQAQWAEAWPEPKKHLDAVSFLLQQVRKYPGEVVLVTIAPLTNIAAAVDRDPAGFRGVRRIVMMGGSIRRGYDSPSGRTNPHPDPEYNIASDVRAAQRVLASGVPIFMMPLDSTQLRLEQPLRERLFAAPTPISGGLRELYRQWGQPTPVLYDPMAVAYVVDPQLCAVRPLHIEIDDQGYTRERAGAPNVEACLKSNPDQFFRFLMPRLLE